MKKLIPEKETEKTYLLTDYGRQKLIHYADSFKAIARNIAVKDTGRENPEEMPGEESERQRYLFFEKMHEEKSILAGNLEEMAGIMSQIAGEVFAFRPFPTGKKRRIRQLLRAEGIHIADIYYIEDDDILRIAVSMNTDRKKKKETAEVANMLSVILNERLIPSVDSPSTVDEFMRTYFLVQEAGFSILSGVARAIKETEALSGDNYSVTETERGYVNVLLSDGMGSGEKACADSEAVLELMEQLLEAGYEPKVAAHLVNASLLASEEEKNMSTLDICSLNLYTGVCEFIKLGAAASYIKRGKMVERIYDSTFPLGAFGDREKNGFCRKLIDGDYVIMVSDGVLDVFDEEEYGEAFLNLVRDMNQENPKEMAESLLQLILFKTGGRIRDDMTILVFGIWENK